MKVAKAITRTGVGNYTQIMDKMKSSLAVVDLPLDMDIERECGFLSQDTHTHKWWCHSCTSRQYVQPMSHRHPSL